MLSLAYSLTPVLGLIYAVLLFAGMFTAALSSLFAITTRVQQRTGGALISRRFISLLCALAFVGSIFGFKNVVSFVYPICGYIGFSPWQAFCSTFSSCAGPASVRGTELTITWRRSRSAYAWRGHLFSEVIAVPRSKGRPPCPPTQTSPFPQTGERGLSVVAFKVSTLPPASALAGALHGAGSPPSQQG